MKKIKTIVCLILSFTLLFSVFMPVNTSAAGNKAVITVDGSAATRPVSGNLFGIFRCRIVPVHPLQNSIAAALQRQMKLGTEGSDRNKPFQKRL